MAKKKTVFVATVMCTDITKKPTGLSISRDGNKFTFAWKIGDSDYGDGQWLRYRTNKGNFSKEFSLGKTATSYSVTLDASKIKNVEFHVRGRRKKYSVKKGKDTYQYNMVASEWATKTWTAAIPGIPSVSYSKGSANSGTFSWNVGVDNKSKQIFNDVEYQTWITNSASTSPSNPTSSSRGNSGSLTYTETLSGKNVVRCVRARSRGPAGNSAWSPIVYHAYGNPAVPEIKTASASATSSNTMSLTVEWGSKPTVLNPIDTITIQYVIDVPTNTSLSAPSSGWTDAATVTSNGGGDKAIVSISESVGTDECMWVRVRSNHDEYSQYSGARRAVTGALAMPAINANPNFSTGVVGITITENTDCDVACTAIFFRPNDNPSQDRIVAIFPNGTTTGTITVSDIRGKSKSCFGAYAFVGTYSGTTIQTSLMRSTAAIDSDIAAVAPAWLSLSAGSKDKTVRVTWPWSWEGATSAEISWADHDDAWESTDQPKTYAIDDIVKSWVVAGLDVGKWYFRVRLKGLIDTDEVTGPWSNIYSYEISSIPDRPALILNKSIINAGQTIMARWVYSAEDDTRQQYAEICLATISNTGVITYGQVIQRVTNAQTVSINRNWTVGNTYYLCLRVTSTANRVSDWSEPVSLTVAPQVSISVVHSLVAGTGESAGILFLKDMPLTATVTGAGASGTTIVSIIRAEDYHIYRPDDSDFDGFEGETIVTQTRSGAGEVTITTDNLIGHLDDGAKYTLQCTVIDEYGQTASAEYPFTVAWTHQAGKPAAEVKIDEWQRIAIITPIAPDNYEIGDVCDIYRLSADKPELIVEGAEFGTTYVDPYPAFGDFGGHRVVTRTANGDYITESNELAWFLCDSEVDDVIEEDSMVIDADGSQIVLPYNIELQNVWNKDFQRTVYLGGSVQGDWNPAVTRDMTANTVILRGRDLDEQVAMRNLAGYAGIAHIRTPDGSSMACDIQIRESSSYQNKRISYSMTVKMVDPPAPEGMLYESWVEMNPPG